jgi:hypothetical protein
MPAEFRVTVLTVSPFQDDVLKDSRRLPAELMAINQGSGYEQESCIRFGFLRIDGVRSLFAGFGQENFKL